MKDSQPYICEVPGDAKYIKANNERFSTSFSESSAWVLSISRRIMKDSQRLTCPEPGTYKYIKANNERFSTQGFWATAKA